MGLSVSGIAVPLDDSVSQLEGSNGSDLDGFAVDDFDCGVKDGKGDGGDGDEVSYSLLVTREGEFASKSGTSAKRSWDAGQTRTAIRTFLEACQSTHYTG